jgi:outer membrane lipoprotein SlyB
MDMTRRLLFLASLCLVVSMPVAAQKSGMSATITLGVVQQVERITLQSTGGGKGAVVGGALGYASGSGKSKSKKRRNAIIGGAAGAALSSSGKSEGRQYTVKVNDGNLIVVVSDQTEIQIGDCVSVEQSGDMANIRRQDSLACQPEIMAALDDVEEELIEDANECAAVKQEIVNAKTQEEIELATAKARILCN